MSYIEKILDEEMGFISLLMLDKIIEENRMHPCLVRCGSGRFMCPAQDVRHFVKIIQRDGCDYVRDISLQRSSKWP